MFGKNTIAGAINITSGKPTDDFEGYIQGGYNERTNGISSTLLLSGPLSDTLRGRVVAKYTDDEGFIENTFKGDDGPQKQTQAIRVSLAWDATDDLSFHLKAESGRFDVVGRQDSIAIASPTATAIYRANSDANFAANLGYNKSSADFPGSPVSDNTDSKVIQLTADYAIGEATLRSITAYTGYEYDNVLDVDYGPLQLLERARNEEHDQFSQELLFTSASGEFLEWMAGAYYQRNTLRSDRTTNVALSDIPAVEASILQRISDATGGAFNFPTGDLNGFATNDFDQKTETLSAFAQSTFNISDTFRTTIGLRFSNDEKEFTKESVILPLSPTQGTSSAILGIIYERILLLAAPHKLSGQREKDHVTGSINFQWDATDDSMFYFNVGNGYKAGGFDEDNALGNLETEEFEDETVISYELGGKMNLWEGRARLNWALFRSEFEDVQVSTFDGNCCFLVGNAAETEVTGFEADWEVLLTEQLAMVGSVSLLDAKYKEFEEGAPCTVAQIQATVANGGARSSCTRSLSGAQLQFAPDWSANLGFDYTVDMNALTFVAGINVNFTDDIIIAADQDANLTQDGFAKVNARLQIGASDDKWYVALVGKNLTDETTIAWGNDVPLGSFGFDNTYFVNIEAPRSFELTGRYSF